MANIIAVVLILAVLALVIGAIVRFRNKPERRLLREFRQLQRLILKGMKGEQRTRARTLLGACQTYLDSLVKARQQQELLLGMVGTARELTGRSVSSQTQQTVAAFNQRIAEDPTQFFASLARISAAANLHRDRAMDELADFTEDLELQRDALYELTLELQRLDPPRHLPENATPETAEERQAVEERDT